MNGLMEGILLVDKPQDWTSHDVVAFIRNRFKLKKVGHAGTLDPMATGLLVILLERATKRSNELSGSDKTYEGIMELGTKTDSHDRTGKVLATGSWEKVSLEEVRQQALKFTGDILQVPPMVSALKHQGVRLYELARKGVEVTREGRNVKVFEFCIKEKKESQVFFSSKVSKGTYVRTLVNDLGEALGCFATLKELRRTQSGSFKIQDAVTIETLRNWTPEEFLSQVNSLRRLYAGL